MKEIIIFDTETNGFKGKSVLSISAFKVNYDEAKNELEKIGEYNRYYFRRNGEKLNEVAIEINGLTDNVITENRTNANYPEDFDDDIESFKAFCGDAKHFIAHNINFDKGFLPYKLENEFCTMLTNTNIVKAPKKKGSGYKWPKLIETAEFYNIELKPEELHNSLYDVEMTFEVFKKMLGTKRTENLTKWFLNK